MLAAPALADTIYNNLTPNNPMAMATRPDVVSLTNGAQFYWLSASRPITGAGGTTPFPTGVTDLQAWTRDAALDPDWLRVGMDIVGGATPPTFNAAFSLDGTVPEPPTGVMLTAALVVLIGFAPRERWRTL